MAYPLPLNMTGNVTSIAVYANTVTNNMFWNFVLCGVLIAGIGIMLSRGIPKEETFTTISLIGLILSFVMSINGLIYSGWIFLFTIILGVSVGLLIKRGDSYSY